MDDQPKRGRGRPADPDGVQERRTLRASKATWERFDALQERLEVTQAALLRKLVDLGSAIADRALPTQDTAQKQNQPQAAPQGDEADVGG